MANTVKMAPGEKGPHSQPVALLVNAPGLIIYYHCFMNKTSVSFDFFQSPLLPALFWGIRGLGICSCAYALRLTYSLMLWLVNISISVFMTHTEKC